MTPKCEFHDEGFRSLHDSLTEIKNNLRNGDNEFREIEKSKLSWKVFTWIMSILMFMWLAVNGIMWNSQSGIAKALVGLDKKISVHLQVDDK